MDAVLIEAGLVVAAVFAIVLSPFGRRTLGEVRHHGLAFRHARHLVHLAIVVALLVAVAAALNVH